MLDKNVEAFVMYVTSFNLNSLLIYLARKAWIALLVGKKVKILIKYLDFLNVFLKEKALILSKAINLNQYAIELQKNQQLLYKSIYSLKLIELEMLKTYIKTNLTNGFIWHLKSPLSAFIFFI